MNAIRRSRPVKSRSQRPSGERHARSCAVQHIADNPLLRGSLVSMARTCGKAGCHCQQGKKHVSLYLAVRVASGVPLRSENRALQVLQRSIRR
jgi:hypothetical protein